MAKTKKTDAKKRVVTHVCLVLDETSSMSPRRNSTISAYNEYLESLKKDEGDEVRFNLTLFNTEKMEQRYKDVAVKDVPYLTPDTYIPDASTPLYDAIGQTISRMKESVGKEELVIFAILTDGEENSSQEYSQDRVKQLIKEQEAKGWKFVFLGVGIDAFASGFAMGLSKTSTFNVNASASAIKSVAKSLSMGSTAMRSSYANHGYGSTVAMNTISESDRKKLAESDEG